MNLPPFVRFSSYEITDTVVDGAGSFDAPAVLLVVEKRADGTFSVNLSDAASSTNVVLEAARFPTVIRIIDSMLDEADLAEADRLGFERKLFNDPATDTEPQRLRYDESANLIVLVGPSEINAAGSVAMSPALARHWRDYLAFELDLPAYVSPSEQAAMAAAA
ncbi:MAG: hypothetical protein AAGA48_41210 [Myxococcota bacterium]